MIGKFGQGLLLTELEFRNNLSPTVRKRPFRLYMFKWSICLLPRKNFGGLSVSSLQGSVKNTFSLSRIS